MSRSRRSTSRSVARRRPAGVAAGVQRRRLRAAFLLGTACFLVYLTNLQPMAVWDSIPARLLPFSILREGNLDFNEFHWLFRLYPKPYFLYHTRGGHWLSRYAIALPVLVAPLSIPVVWWQRHGNIDDDDVRFRLATVVTERVGAATVAAVSVGLVFLALCYVTSVPTAVGISLVYGLGTTAWAIGSQTLIQHGLCALALAGMSLFLLGPDTRRNAVVAGGFAALAVLARPTMIVFALLAFVFMCFERRRHLIAFLSLPIAGMFALFAYNARLAHLATGAYAHPPFTLPRFRRFALLLFGPNRGLFIYTPAALLVLPGLLWRPREAPRWVHYLPAGILAYVVFYSCWPGWTGGKCYGPRFLTDALPAIALCAVPAVERLWRSRRGRAWLLGLAAWGVVVQGIGVYCGDGSWNRTRGTLGSRAGPWSWKDTQIARALGQGWHGGDLAPLLWQTVTDPHPARLQPLQERQLAGEITILERPPYRFPAGSHVKLGVRLVNRGDVTWPAFSDYGYLQCKLGYRWWSGGKMSMASGAALLPRNLAPGESARMKIRVETPQKPGLYEIELIVLQVIGADKGLSGTVLRVPVQVG